MKYYQSNIALGTKAEITLVSKEHQNIEELLRNLWLSIFKFEKRFSRFLPDSELSFFNKNAGTQQKISAEFIDILQESKIMAERTKGIFNPFILPNLQKAGYKNTMLKEHKNDDFLDFSSRKLASYTQLIIGKDWAQIPYGSAIDLGGIGKGYLLDRLAEIIEKTIDNYWVSLGGDVIAKGKNESGKPWVINVQKANASGPIAYIENLSMQRLAATTSGIDTRKGVNKGKNWHHIIDPRTNLPSVSDVVVSTVCNSSAVKADVLAKVAVIVGSTEAKNTYSSLKIKDYLMQFIRGSEIDYEVSGNKISLKTDKIT